MRDEVTLDGEAVWYSQCESPSRQIMTAATLPPPARPLVAIGLASPRMDFRVTVLTDVRVIVMPEVPAGFAVAVGAMCRRHGHATGTETAFRTGDIYRFHAVDHVSGTSCTCQDQDPRQLP